MSNKVEIPTPKYRIGDIVYYPSTESVQVKSVCPDCGGTGEWSVTTATRTFKVACKRCEYERQYGDGSLAVYVRKPRVTECTVKGFAIKPHGYGKDAGKFYVWYYLSQGSDRTEEELFPDRASAEKAAIAKADKENADRAETTNRDELIRLQDQDIAAAVAYIENKARLAIKKRYDDMIAYIGDLMHESVNGIPSSVSYDHAGWSSSKIMMDDEILAYVSLHLLKEAGEDIPDNVKEATGYCDD